MIRPTTMMLSSILLLMVSMIINVSGLAVMSVDLGTEYMKIAIVKPGIPMEIALNKYVRVARCATLVYHVRCCTLGRVAERHQ